MKLCYNAQFFFLSGEKENVSRPGMIGKGKREKKRARDFGALRQEKFTLRYVCQFEKKKGNRSSSFNITRGNAL